MAIPEKSSRVALRGGLGAGVHAQLPKGAAPKGTTVTLSHEGCSTLSGTRLRSSLSGLLGQLLQPLTVSSLFIGVHMRGRGLVQHVG